MTFLFVKERKTEMNSNDKKIFDLKKKLEQKKNALGNKPVIQFKTNCAFTLFGICYNLHTMDEFELEMLSGWLKNLNPEIFVNNNFKVGDYISDITGKLTLLDYNKHLGNIKLMEKRLDDLISSETKTSIEIDKLAEQIG